MGPIQPVYAVSGHVSNSEVLFYASWALRSDLGPFYEFSRISKILIIFTTRLSPTSVQIITICVFFWTKSEAIGPVNAFSDRFFGSWVLFYASWDVWFVLRRFGDVLKISKHFRHFSASRAPNFHHFFNFWTFPDPIFGHIFQLPEAVTRRHKFSQRADFTPSTQNWVGFKTKLVSSNY